MRRSVLLFFFAIGVFPIVRADEPEPPRVVAAWAAGPFETRICFDRTIDENLPHALVGRSIALDESRRRVGENGTGKGPTGSIKIAAARRVDENRTLVLTTDPHPRAAVYALEVPTRPSVKLEYDLTGVEASWTEGGKDESPETTTMLWWPTLNPEAVRNDLARSPAHAAFFKTRLTRPGTLTLTTLVVPPRGSRSLVVEANLPFEATLNGEGPPSRDGAAVFPSGETSDPMLLTVTIKTGDSNPAHPVIRLTGRGASTPDNPVAMFLPWTPASPPTPAPLESVPDLSGGDPRQGALIFAGAEAKCATCHRIRGEGATVGPDLSNLLGRDRTEVYREIAEPSARINPDYVPYTIALKDGRILVGTVRAEGADAIKVSDTDAKIHVILRAEIDEFRPSATSVMPVGLAGAIGPDRLRDLIAFLTSPPAK